MIAVHRQNLLNKTFNNAEVPALVLPREKWGDPKSLLSPHVDCS
jgi:hypothetical protein